MRIIDELKAHLDLADIAGRYTNLQTAGKHRLKGLCPLHKETEPSFYIYSDSQSWHCFGCGKGGDALDLVQALEGWDFSTTMRELARQSGFNLPAPDAKTQALWQKKRQMAHIFNTAVGYFQQLLEQPDSPGMAYAVSRGWHPETIRDARLGYYDGIAPALRQVMTKAGIDPDAPAAKAVLRTPGPSLVYPFIFTKSVSYYAVRLINPPPGKAKAWNPPSELAGAKPLYYNHLYTPNTDSVIIVEGQGDAVTCAQWGMPAIATVGAHSVAGLEKKLAHHQQVYIGVEKNEAGEHHAYALAEILHPTVKLLLWPQDDANAWLQDGGTKQDLRALMDQAPTWLDIQVEQAHHTPPSDAQVKRLFRTIAKLDAFQMARQKDIIRDKLNLTARTFNSLLRLAQGEQPPSRVAVDSYCVSSGAICRKVLDADGSIHLSPLCNFDARVVREVLIDDGLEVGRSFHITGTLNDGSTLPEIDIPAENYGSMDWVLEKWGVRATVNVGPYKYDHLRCAIQQLSEGAELCKEYGHLGWREIDGHLCFLSNSGALGNGQCTVSLVPDLMSYHMPTHIHHDGRESASASLGFWDVGDLSVTVPLWSMMYLAPLTSLIYPSFTLWIYGTTGTMKSTITALAMSHYGQFSYDKPTTSWSSTTFGLQRLAFLAKDTPLWIDDYNLPSTLNGKRILQDKAEQLLREWGNRSIRSAGQRNGQLRAGNYPRGLVVTTAETLPGTVSIRARLFTVEMHPGMVTGGNGSKLTRAQKVEAALYASCMAGYLTWLTGQWPDLGAGLQELFAKRLSLAQDRLTVHPRSASNAAMLGTGLEMGLRYMLSTGILDQEDAEGRMVAGWDILLQLAERQDTDINREFDSVDLFFKALDSILTQGSGHIRSLIQPDAESMVRPNLRTTNSLLLGWYDRDNWYLLPQITYQAVYQFYRNSGILFPDTENGVKTKLQERGLIAKSNQNRNYYQLRIKNERKRVLVVPTYGNINDRKEETAMFQETLEDLHM